MFYDSKNFQTGSNSSIQSRYNDNMMTCLGNLRPNWAASCGFLTTKPICCSANKETHILKGTGNKAHTIYQNSSRELAYVCATADILAKQVWHFYIFGTWQWWIIKPYSITRSFFPSWWLQWYFGNRLTWFYWLLKGRLQPINSDLNS